MIKTGLTVLVAGMMALAAGTAMAAIAGPADNNIRFTVHNFSNDQGSNLPTRVYKSSNEDQICIFCHTPHNANPSRPLWNKVLPTQSFNMYTSSASLTTVARKVTMPGPESLLCLSCHDGRTAVNVLHNTRNPVAVDQGDGSKVMPMDGFGTDIMSMGQLGFAGYGANLGKLNNESSEITDTTYGANLTDDHPISFSYTGAYGEKVAKGDDSLKDINLARTQGARFFGKDNRVECSSCHNPHVAYGESRWGGVLDPVPGNSALKPFLVRDNDGSALCLACHNK